MAMLLFFIVFSLGQVVIRMLGWNLPRARSLKEFVLAVYWIHPPDIERWRICRYRFAQFIAALIGFVAVIITGAMLGQWR